MARSQRSAGSVSAGLYEHLHAKARVFDDRLAQRFARDGYRSSPILAEFAAGRPVPAAAWQLPRQLREVLGIGPGDVVTVAADDEVMIEPLAAVDFVDELAARRTALGNVR